MIHPGNFASEDLLMLLGAAEDGQGSSYYYNNTLARNYTGSPNMHGYGPGMYGMMPIIIQALSAIRGASSIRQLLHEIGMLMLTLFFANSLFSASVGFYAMTSFLPFVKRKAIHLFNWLFPTEYATISVDQHSDVYMILNNWLYRKAKFVHVPNELQVDLKDMEEDMSGEYLQELIFYPVDNEEREFSYDGHSIFVSDGKSDNNKSSSKGENAAEQLEALFVKSKRLLLRIKGEENLPVLKKLLREAKEMYAVSSEDKTLIYFYKESWNQWLRLNQQESRTLNSVYLDPTMKEDLLHDMDRFFDSSTSYRKNGTPWRRGYLFHGLPGTGKTSLVSALAAKYDLNLAILNVSDMRDSNFMQAVHKVPPRSILLIEDIDALFKSEDEQKESARYARHQLNFSTFLNCIDGVGTPEGRITIMTTNHIEKLDPALIRPGRIDRKFEFTYATPHQKLCMCKAFFKDMSFANKLVEGLANVDATTAQIQCVLQYYQNNVRTSLDHVQPIDVTQYFELISKNYNNQKTNAKDEINMDIVLYEPMDDASKTDSIGRGKLVHIQGDIKKDTIHSLIAPAVLTHFQQELSNFLLIHKVDNVEITSVEGIKEKIHYIIEKK